jgi:predicted amidophosphoribosyltransferase
VTTRPHSDRRILRDECPRCTRSKRAVSRICTTCAAELKRLGHRAGRKW